MTRNLSVFAKASRLAIAAALVAGPSPVLAQSLQGTPAVSSGSANVSEGSGTTTVTLNTGQTVIDWTPDDNAVGNFGAINFQPAGTTATFQNNPDLVGDFAVLNRVNVTDHSRIVALNGTINSLVNGQTGGSVFFYSPSGFVLTGTAVINVGSLVLSALPITVDGNGNFINGGTVVFGQAPNPNAAINTVSDINGTARINSSGNGNYVALVAPTILHQGDIRTDGTAALVAAEAATINFDPFGLFDIEVTIGTDAAQGIHVDGGTIGRNSETVSSDNIHRAYLVTVAKNDAVTMLINNGASIGFEIGTSASVEDNAVVISGGYDIDNGSHQFFGTSGVSNVPLTITNATLSSNVDAQVTGGAAINSGQGALTFGGDFDIIGGETTTTGGNVLIEALNGNDLTIGGDLFARAFRRNADGSETGLITKLGAETASTVNIGGDVTLDSDSFGTTIGEFGEFGTNAVGGNAQVNIGANSTLNVTGSVTVHADGHGGNSFGGTAGNGMGGQALVMANNGNATVIIGGSVSASASGFGGSYIECSECGVTGGNGIGNNASVHTGGGPGNLMQIGGDVTITAEGHGGAGDAQAGSGFGGTANLGAFDNAALTVAGNTEIDADGFGGDGVDNQGGLGRGGTARIGTNSGGSIELTGPVLVTADGEGGGSFTLGGTGTGGLAQVSAFLGTIHAFNNVSVSAHSSGGFAFGSGTGGDGLADIETEITPGMTEASLFAGGGTLTIDGLTVVSAGATGGNGGFDGGDGGNAVAAGVAGTILGGAIIHAGNSDDGPSVIQLGGVTVSAEASGGAGGDGQGGTNGSDGGNGGSATGGKAVMTAAAGNGDLTAGAVIISASAVGGRGGNGGNGDGGNGGNAGHGGGATGGFINIGTESGNASFAQASNDGVATYATILAFARATGGDGGHAGAGTVDGLAGNGGDAQGGDVALLVRGSTVNVTDVDIDASAFGGNGGLDPSESFEGIGGDAITGAIGVLATNRFLLPDQRGTLNAGSITGTAIAQGGPGATNGGSYTLGGGAFFEVVNTEVTADSVNLVVGAVDGIDPDATETFTSRFAIVEGTVDIAGSFNIQTPGQVSVHVDNPEPVSSLTAASFTISADNFVHDPTRPLPADIGVISADTIGLGTAGDLIVDAHLVSTGSLSLSAPGLVDIEDATSGGDINGSAGTSFTAGSLTGAGSVNVTATDAISLDLVNSGTQITILSFLGAISANGMSSSDGSIFLDGTTGVSTGPLTAMNEIVALSETGDVSVGDTTSSLGSIALSAGGSITTGDLAAQANIDMAANGGITFQDATADRIDFESGGAVSGGNIIAGTFATGEAEGAITLGNINVGILRAGGATDDGFAVGIVSATSVSVQDVAADEAVGFATRGSLTTGNVTAGGLFMALAGGDITTGSITTTGGFSQVYMADDAMYDIGTENGTIDFDASLVLPFDPIATGGSIAIGGPVTTGLFQAAAGTNFSALGISSSSDIGIFAGGSITALDLTGGDSLLLEAGGSVDVGDLSAGLVDPSVDEGADYEVKILAGGNILTGDIAAAGHIGLATPGTMTTGNIAAGGVFMALGHGDMSFGNATASEVFLSDYAILNLGGLTATCIGACGTGGADGVVTAPPTGPSYGYVTTAGGIDGAGQLPGQEQGSTNGTVYTTSEFEVSAGEALDFWFNYVTSDGSGFADYAWAGLFTAGLDPVAILYTARTQPDGTIVPGQGLPGVEATLDPATVPIIDGAPVWSPLAEDSGTCFDVGCGYTGWVSSSYEIAEAGTYVLRFGVSNWDDTAYQSGMAFSGLSIGGVSATPTLLTRTGGSISIGNVETGRFSAAAGTDLTTGIIDSSGSITLDAGGAIVTQNLFAGNFLRASGGSIQTGNVLAASVDLLAGADIGTGNIGSSGGALLNAGGSIATGNIDAATFLEGHAGTDIDTGDVDAGGNIILTADIGAISIGGASAGGNFQANAGADLSAGAISATDIDATAGGTAAIGGAWSAQFVRLVSSDIDITANGSIAADEIDLLSSNSTQTVVGDGVTGGGYQLSDAEYDRLDSSDIDVIADAALGAATRILIGDLSVTAPNSEFGSEYEFVTFDSESENVVGSIRIVGDALFSGMGANDGVAFTTNLFELDAATGLLSLESSPGTLGGTIFLDAAHIHVASGTILDQLAEDPQYDGYQDDLNAPAEVQRPDGVVRAGSIEIEFADGGEAELNTLYVQNTGTADNPAGFLVSGAALFGEGNEVTPPPGSIDLVINGQIVTEGGTLTGVEVRDALVEAEGDITPFTENSTINGCLLTGSCQVEPPEPPFPPGFNPAGPGIQDEITLIDRGLLPPPKFGNEDFIDDNVETTTDGATSPITPPTPLFDTSELGGKSDVDDPVSGSGNPALMEAVGTNRPGDGSPAAPAGSVDCPAGGSQPAGQCKQEKQP